jgi:peptidyl-prolyl cis-trans isomerase SurA
MKKLFITLSLILSALSTQAFAASEQVIAVVNNSIITMLDLKQRSQLIARQMGDEKLANRSDIQERAMNELVDELLRIDYAEQLGMGLTDSAIEDFNNFMLNNPEIPQGVYASIINGLEESVKQQIKGQLLWRQVVERTLKKRVVISDAEVDTLVNGLLASANIQEYRLRHIFIENRKDRSPTASERAAQIAQEITPESDFAALAKRYSEDKTAENGGLLGWLNTSEMITNIAKAVETLEVGKVSPPIRSSGGWHIIKLDDTRTAEPPTGSDLERMRERIQKTLTSQRLELTTRRLMRDLRRRAFIEIRTDS